MKVEIEAEELIKLVDALEFYANPNVYWACSFFFDRPTGGFDEDFSDYHEFKDFCPEDSEFEHQNRERPGLTARKALRELINNEKELIEKLVDIEHQNG